MHGTWNILKAFSLCSSDILFTVALIISATQVPDWLPYRKFRAELEGLFSYLLTYLLHEAESFFRS
jgi:hypothetical protein